MKTFGNRQLYKQPNEVKDYWNKQANSIDIDFLKTAEYALYNHSWHTTLKEMIEGGNITNESRILEIGCGWGRLLVGFKKKFPGSQVTGIDITKDFLEKAKFILKKELGSCNVSVLQGDAMKLNFEEDFFDTVVTSRVLQYVENPQKAVDGCYRVLKKGGRLVVCLPNKWNLIRILTYRTKLYSPSEVAIWMDRAGFKVVQKKTINFFPSSIYRFNEKNKIIQTFEKIMQTLPFVKWVGALGCVVGEKV